MDPGQRDVCRHRAEGDRVVPDTGKVVVGRPVVGDQLGLRGDGAEHEGMKFLLAKALDHLEPGAPWLAAVDFDRAGAPDGFGYSWFCDLYRGWAGRLKPTMRQTHIAGEKLFVDFAGRTGEVVDGLRLTSVPVLVSDTVTKAQMSMSSSSSHETPAGGRWIRTIAREAGLLRKVNWGIESRPALTR